jgi:glycosyltransferase involved in cell wall biosynthesis
VLTVIVPVYNEARTVFELLGRVMAAPYAKQIVVVDDGSSDGTAEILTAWESRSDSTQASNRTANDVGRKRGSPGYHETPACAGNIEILRHAANRGKGAAICTGLQHARGRFTIIQDADLEYDPAEYPLLIEPLLAGKAEVVYGSRYLPASTVGNDGNALKAGLQVPRLRGQSINRYGVGILNLVIRLLYGVRLTDEATCYKAFPTDVLRRMHLVCEQFEFCPEVTAKALRMGLSILEVPIHYDARSFQAGKKIRWTDGVAAIATLWKWRNWRPDPCRPTAPQSVQRHNRHERRQPR